MRGLVLGALALSAALFSISCGTVVWTGLRAPVGPADVGVVLGSRVERDGRLSARLRAWLDAALGAYCRGLVTLLPVSAGREREGQDEARAMRIWLVAHGVPAGRVFEDPGGRNAWLTAHHARAFMGARAWRTALVISQHFYIPRCRLAFARVGAVVVGGAWPRHWEPRDLLATAREVPALVKHALRRD